MPILNPNPTPDSCVHTQAHKDIQAYIESISDIEYIPNLTTYYILVKEEDVKQFLNTIEDMSLSYRLTVRYGPSNYGSEIGIRLYEDEYLRLRLSINSVLIYSMPASNRPELEF